MGHPFFHTHLHSHFSINDAMSPIPDMVAKAERLGQPAMAITDHGVMGGAFQLYNECKKRGMAPFPGIEAYMVESVPLAKEAKSANRYHLGLLALDYEGYKALVALTSYSHTRERFYQKPLIDTADLARLAETGASQHIAVLSGCYFGLLSQTLIRVGWKAALQVARAYASWFPHYFVEIQHHRTDHGDGWDDNRLAVELARLADAVGLPVILTQDAHYIDAKHKVAHDTMKSLAYGKLLGEDAFPGDSYHLCGARHIRDHLLGDPQLERIWAESRGSYERLVELNRMKIPALDSYQFLMPHVCDNPVVNLRRQARTGLAQKFGRLETERLKVYQDTLDGELEIIAETGFAAYFLIIAEICEYARTHGIRVQTRGSANGSLVCHLLGISHIDPVRWGLTMEGFLTKDRSKPPDIDLDVEQLRRGELIAWVAKRYPNIQQATPSTWGWNEETGQGSLFVQHINAERRRLSAAEFKRRYPNPDHPMSAIRNADPEMYAKLALVDEIKPWKAFGSHPSGYILDNPHHPLVDIVPTMYIASSDRTITQMLMDDLEAAGYVKLDMLGLRTLSSMALTLELVGQTWADVEALPLDDRATFEAIARTQPANGTFQLEGFSVAKGVRRMRPRDITELIHAVALFRPGIPDEAVDRYMANRRHPKRITYRHDITRTVLGPTYGTFVFTEQVLQIARAISMDPLDVQRLLKAMKVKHGKFGYNAESEKAFNESRQIFIDACCGVGMTVPVAEALFEDIYGFNRYAFKAAHATPYGILAYWTAYYRHHHPAEFYTGILCTVNVTKPEDQGRYVRAAKDRGVRILPPRINQSGVSWTLDTGAIRQGLAGIKGVGIKAATELVTNGPYTDVGEIEDRCATRLVTGFKTWHTQGRFSGVMEKLQAAGALETLAVAKGATRPMFKIRAVRPKATA